MWTVTLGRTFRPFLRKDLSLGDCAGEKYRIWTSRKRETGCWVRPGSRLDQGSLDMQRICFKGKASEK